MFCATDLLQRGLEIEEKHLALLIAVGSEQRKQNYMSTFTGTTYRISIALQETRNNPTAARIALITHTPPFQYGSVKGC
ncbi:MAG: hypothetical protein SAK29_05185 [Scytonema sp. PMC 1069.18]|nr:hypothetical protein [Scytonema sp. PMC 1069.18]MEC4884912.1 hypothetical protein [Scytonema sp. PMC 1070.18]